ncbi:protein giant-like [Actinia tenebrosa]|uniref:Protein giant-like n=1 Tax=Actinia tenebrosa TaxID=6105 RepID=A0A6P8I5U1_ACTTE|nr:protein giant-like [Actinia tenebrosa]
MMSSSINKDYMDIDEFLSSRDICEGLSFPESDYADEDFGSITDLAEGTDNLEALLDEQLQEYTVNEIIEPIQPASPLSSNEGNGRSISPDSFSSSQHCRSPGEDKAKKENVKTRGKRVKKAYKEMKDSTESNSSKARTSTWHVSKSPDKKCLATSVEIEGVSYTYKLLPTAKNKKQRRQSVPGDLKDGKYWDRRLKNNLAAKRSRDLRRQKEMTVAHKAANLEAANKELQNEVAKLKEQNTLQ